MAYFLKGPKEEKTRYFIGQHGGTNRGTIQPDSPVLAEFCKAVAALAFEPGEAVVLFRDSDEIEPAPTFDDAASLLAHLGKRDHSGRIEDPRPATVVAVPRNVAEAL